VYGFIDRADPVEELNTFDVANPASPMGERFQTTVPQQFLFLMNSPLVVEQVRNVINRNEFLVQKSDEDRIRFLYELFFARVPSDEEIRSGLDFLATTSPEQPLHSLNAGSQEFVGQVKQRPKGGPGGKPKVSHKPLTAWQEYAHALLLTNEASFVN
jgi:hypothetical protein